MITPSFKTMKLVFGLFLLLVIILILVNTKGCDEPVKPEPKKKIENIKKTPPKIYTDAGGTTHTEKPVAKADMATIKASYQRIIDSLAAVIRIKEKRITDLQQVGTTTSGTFKPRVDTIYVNGGGMSYEVSYNDAWLHLHGVVNEDSSWHYSIKDSITLVTYYKKTGFLKLGRTLVLDGFSQNPNTTITGLTSIKIDKAKPKKWGIGLNVSYGYDGTQFKPFVGVGLTRTLIRF